MRISISTISLSAIAGASAAALQTGTSLEGRQTSLGTWYLVGFAAECNLACFADIAIFGAENAVQGFPAFAARCSNMGGCENPTGGSKVDTSIFAESGKYTITQTATINGVNKTAKAAIPWDIWARNAAYVEVAVTSVA
ncbi:hypothetical protein ONZ43_g2745 [Nemania bipapillata]|uniref:Uncharacterized protein n=1 Tax=Nemania bipapillata TaxID=110536 RepID=A0ACC2IZF2_9PEZI|nr:hypothetical protein ONZ43_g2745 [Nemania bipapillata]